MKQETDSSMPSFLGIRLLADDIRAHNDFLNERRTFSRSARRNTLRQSLPPRVIAIGSPLRSAAAPR
jgi:hypothetical protein